MKIAYLLTFIVLFPLSIFSQNTNDYLKLVEELNESLFQYSKLSPFATEYLPIDSFNLSEDEIKELLAEANYDANLTSNKDSIDSYYMIFYFQGEVVEYLNEVIRHPDFEKYDIQALIKSDELSIVKSDDGKIHNFSIDEKMGGTYRSRISIMHFTNLINTDSATQNVSEDIFARDGYNGIYALHTEQGTKYVLTGDVRGCSYCFETFVELISIQDNQLHQDFYFSTVNRDWENGAFYDHNTKTIDVAYDYDDLTAECSCSKDPYAQGSYGENDLFEYQCKCKYVFDGSNFECTEGRLERTYHPRTEFPEILGFRMAKNQKEVKLLRDQGSNLYYVFLKPNGLAEFSYPTYILQDEEFTINPSQDTLVFQHGNTIYKIYEIRNQENLVDIGILVDVNGRTYDLKGDKNSLKGSIKAIESETFNNVTQE